ncbi:MAG TPA: 3-hydroxyacyl-CoA dehydrogenase PaaH, partial [Tianweitania sediminis]|nr:3-hydroxyacyl-CoA dehydrogenase PaaH [Tianweitania sediminis]
MPGLKKNAVVAVVGAGAMGAGIAQVAAQAGHEVLLFDAAEGAATKGRASILAALDRLVEKSRLSSVERDAVASRLIVAQSVHSLAPAQLVIEAIVEKLDVKRQVFAALEEIVGADTVLATNTSSLSVTAIAAGLQHPKRVAGLHFFNPAPVMKLVEIVAGLASDKGVLEVLEATARDWGKVPVHVTSTPGFIVNRVARPFYAEALRLLEEGATGCATIDAIMRDTGGFRMGPFELMDLIGHDVNAAVTRSVFEAYFYDPRFRPSLVQQELVSAGWLGRKSGRGFYDYRDPSSRAEPEDASASASCDSVTVEGDLGPAEPLVDSLKAAGVKVTRKEGSAAFITSQGVRLALTDGRTATARVAAGEPGDLVLFDLALDYRVSPRMCIAVADQASGECLPAAVGLLRAAGKTVSVVDDAPGLVVFRTLAMLVNEAAEAVLQGVASADDIDKAMTLGVNYPRGPLSWGDAVGPSRILAGLGALQSAYGDDRYRASQWLRRRAQSGRALVEAKQDRS